MAQYIETINQYELLLKKQLIVIKDKKLRDTLFKVAYQAFLDGLKFSQGKLKA